MHQSTMQQYANEKINNARRMADIQREVDKANFGRKVEGSSIISLLSTLRISLLKVVKIRPARNEQAVNLSES